MMEPMSQARVDASVPTLRLPVVPVTVVVVTRGLSDYLPRTLEALAGQTRPPDQVLLVDAAADATDGTRDPADRADLPALAGRGRGRVGAGSTRRADDGRSRAGRPRRGGAARTDAGPGLALAAARRQRAGADGARGAAACRGAGPVGRPRGLQAAHLVRPGTGARGGCVDLPVRPTDDRAGRARGGPGLS